MCTSFLIQEPVAPGEGSRFESPQPEPPARRCPCGSAADLQPVKLCGGEKRLHQVDGDLQARNRPLCLSDAVITVSGRGDFEAKRLIAEPVVLPEDFRVSHLLGVHRFADADVEVSVVLVDGDLVACVLDADGFDDGVYRRGSPVN